MEAQEEESAKGKERIVEERIHYMKVSPCAYHALSGLEKYLREGRVASHESRVGGHYSLITSHYSLVTIH